MLGRCSVNLRARLNLDCFIQLVNSHDLKSLKDADAINRSQSVVQHKLLREYDLDEAVKTKGLLGSHVKFDAGVLANLSATVKAHRNEAELLRLGNTIKENFRTCSDCEVVAVECSQVKTALCARLDRIFKTSDEDCYLAIAI